MPSLLEKIGLKTSFTVELEITQEEFVSRFRKEVDTNDTHFFLDPFYAFSPSPEKYKGKISMKGFEIRRNPRFFNNRNTYARAKGTFEQVDQRLLIQTSINSWHPTFFVLILFTFLFWTIALCFAESLAFVIFMLQGLFILGIPYLIMRSATKNLQRELEKDFLHLIKK